ncbi:suppressor of disruption of TFIIS-like [Humulus lupulus]|uniref:suppressor of disruption of TFIIS-like n=1 Tax=Humulus lupulus TaxID=3486 RepID=UPI002B40CCC1|nr:suppressor of disruption of TFIIS-like [Humulus lupulus]
MENKDQFQQSLESKYDCLLFDLDDTLYSKASGLSAQVTKNIKEYMIQKLEIEEDKVPELCSSLYKNYGTTMAGLKAMGYGFDFDDFHSFVHGRLPYNLLKPDHVLRSLLLSIPIPKVIFTNADKNHAARALSRLGLEDCFQDIICFETLNPNYKEVMPAVSNDEIELGPSSNNGDSALPKTPVVCKPFDNSFDEVFKMLKINPQRAVFFDDNILNIQTGKKLGLTTVWVGCSHRIAGVDYALESIHNIKEAIPELWVAEESKSVKYSRKVGIATIVQA